MCELCAVDMYILSQSKVVQHINESKEAVLNTLSNDLMFGGSDINDYSILVVRNDEAVEEIRGAALQAELDGFLERGSGCPL